MPATCAATGRAMAYVVVLSETPRFGRCRFVAVVCPRAPRPSRPRGNRLIRLAGRNLTTLGPLMSKRVAGTTVNHRETRRLGEQVRDDLRRPRAEAMGGETVSR